MLFVVGHVTAIALYSSANGIAAMDQDSHRAVSLQKVLKTTEELDTSVNDSIIVKEPAKWHQPREKAQYFEIRDLPLKAGTPRKCNVYTMALQYG